jgi:protocatechuate 4,5-dioxygenase alpha chain
MSLAAVELCLFDLGNSGRTRRAYADSPDSVLARYALDGEERALIAAEDVGALFRRGANPMLLMGFYMGLHGPAAIGDYLKKMPTLASVIDGEG